MCIYWTVSLQWSGSKSLISLFVEVRQEKKIKDPGKTLQAVSEQAAREAVLGLACLHGEEDFLGDVVGWRSQVGQRGGGSTGPPVLLQQLEEQSHQRWLWCLPRCCLPVLHLSVEAMLCGQHSLARA